MVIPRNSNSNFSFQICPVTGWGFPVIGRGFSVTGNPDPPREFFSVGNQNLGYDRVLPIWKLHKRHNAKFSMYLLAL
jgi:hypothetical protein